MTTERPAGETPAALTPHEARHALADEWNAANPTTPEQVAAFYRDSQHMADDVEAFHTDPVRQTWTDAIVYLAQHQEIKTVVDIGAGAGHDLLALSGLDADFDLHGVEPNTILRQRMLTSLHDRSLVPPVGLHADVSTAPIERADLLVCIDVLEHVPDPESFLSIIATRAPIGCWLVEATATHDCGTPLHLKQNWSWQPGHALEAAGWENMQTVGRLRVWRRVREACVPRATLMVCAYRSVSLPTFRAVLDSQRALHDQGWRVYLGGEAGIHRSRNIAASKWYRGTADDVFVMLDDDLVFRPDDLARLTDLCRNGHDIICAAYPVRDGGHLALRQQGGPVTFGPAMPPVEITYAATGFLAVHRRVLDALVPTLPLLHANTPFAHWGFFDFPVVESEVAGGHEMLSEDYAFSQKARAQGFTTWLDPSIFLGHLGEIEVSVRNMELVYQSTQINRNGEGG